MVFFTNQYNFDMEETEQQIDCHAHNQHDQVAAIDRWLFVKQEEHDAISLAEAYFFKIAFMFEMFCIFVFAKCFKPDCVETFCSNNIP